MQKVLLLHHLKCTVENCLNVNLSVVQACNNSDPLLFIPCLYSTQLWFGLPWKQNFPPKKKDRMEKRKKDWKCIKTLQDDLRFKWSFKLEFGEWEWKWKLVWWASVSGWDFKWDHPSSVEWKSKHNDYINEKARALFEAAFMMTLTH